MIFELTAQQRVNIISKRLINLRNGSGDYTADQREREVERAQSALRQAFRDSGIGRYLEINAAELELAGSGRGLA